MKAKFLSFWMVLSVALSALQLGGCVDQEPPVPEPEPLGTPIDPYGDHEAPLSAAGPLALAFGATQGLPYQAGQAAQWQFAAAKGGQFALQVATYAKGVALYATLERQTAGGWLAVKTAAGTGGLQLGLTPASDGSYRLSVIGGNSQQYVYAKLICVKGICALPQCPSSPTSLAAQALGQLKRAVGSLQVAGKLKGVLYMSESDYPVELVALAGAAKSGPVEPSELQQALGLPPNTVVDTAWTTGKFYSGLEKSGLPAAHVKLLEQVLNGQATQWRVLRVGKVQVQVWLLGRTACGALVGLRTTLIET